MLPPQPRSRTVDMTACRNIPLSLAKIEAVSPCRSSPGERVLGKHQESLEANTAKMAGILSQRDQKRCVTHMRRRFVAESKSSNQNKLKLQPSGMATFF